MPDVSPVQTAVTAEVEVVYLTISAAGRLMAAGLGTRTDGRLRFVTGGLEPGEQPANAADRILRDVAGITASVHRPVLVGASARVTESDDAPAVALTYVAFGRIENNPREPWARFRVLDGTHQSEFASPETLDAALISLRSLIWTTDICGRVAANKYGLFTLKRLRSVFEAVLDESLDPANFRRRVEAIKGLLVERPEDQSLYPEGSSYRDRPRGRGRRPTVYRIPS